VGIRSVFRQIVIKRQMAGGIRAFRQRTARYESSVDSMAASLDVSPFAAQHRTMIASVPHTPRRLSISSSKRMIRVKAISARSLLGDDVGRFEAELAGVLLRP
jgi:hypothetical protein